MIHFSLFSGLGGFDLAAEWMGWKNYVSCEIQDFPNKVLEYHFPDAYHHRDVNTLTYDTINTELTRRFGSHWRNEDIVLTGGFP
jgi:DNA (cytosine-5)-methyltransferase 1